MGCLALVFLCSIGLVACQNGNDNIADSDSEAATAKPVTVASNKPVPSVNAATTSPGKRSAPISFRYEIEGTPIVGQPVAIKIMITSSVTDAPVSVFYRVQDASSMLFPESQTQRRVFAAENRDELRSQQVTVVPQREGRLYLNVSAEVETANGMMIKTISIPIQVGSAPPELEVNGKLVETADGEVVISMPAE